MGARVARAVAVTILLLGTVTVGAVLGEGQGVDVQVMTGEQYSVQWLLQDRPLDEEVRVTGTVVHVKSSVEEMRSDEHQRFVVSDVSGQEAILVVCSLEEGAAPITVGDGVRITGTFEGYKGSFRVKAVCSRITVF